jgi:hypothetical protein
VRRRRRSRGYYLVAWYEILLASGPLTMGSDGGKVRSAIGGIVVAAGGGCGCHG